MKLICPECSVEVTAEMITVGENISLRCEHCNYARKQPLLTKKILDLRPSKMSGTKLNEDREIKEEKKEEKINASPWGHLGLKYEQILQIKEILPSQLFSDKVIVEVGSGSGWLSGLIKFIESDNLLISTDISPYWMNFSTEVQSIMNTTVDYMVVIDTENFSIASNQLDIVIGAANLHHYPNPRKALLEIKRVLKPAGLVKFLYEPVMNPLMKKLFYKKTNFYKKSVRYGVTENVFTLKTLENFGKLFFILSIYTYD